MNTNALGLRLLLSLLAGLLGVACGGEEAAAPFGNGAGQTATLSIADSSAMEGDVGSTMMRFDVSLSKAVGTDVTFDFTSNVVTADSFDFVVDTGSATIAAGDTRATVEVEITGDPFFETDETLTVNLENLPSTVKAGDMEAFGTIRTDDLPLISIAEAEVVEGDVDPRIMIFAVALQGITNDVSVDFETTDLTATTADNDYVERTATLDIPAGTTNATIEIEVIGDVAPEPREEFLLTLTDLRGDAVLHPALDSALGAILDNDTPIVLDPTVSAPPAYGGEGDVGIRDMFVNLSLNTAVATDVVIDYATSDIGSAEAGVDYNATKGRLRIPAGTNTAAIPIELLGDPDVEGPEYFNLNLTLITKNVRLDTPRVLCTILEDDLVGPPFLSVIGGSIFEGDSGTKNMRIDVAMSYAASGVVTMDYETRDVTALAGSDYESTTGSLSFAVGETVETILVPIHGDTVIEAHEYFEVALTNVTGTVTVFDAVSEGIIETDDPFAMVSIEDISQFEGDAGSTDMVFKVSIDAVAGDPVTVDYASGDDIAPHIASAGDDYTAVSGSISIPAGDTEATVTVQIEGDLDVEFDETFAIKLDNVSQNAELEDDLGVGRIVNDETTPGWGVPHALSQEGQDNMLPRISMNASGEATALWVPRSLGSFESSRYTPGGGWESYEIAVPSTSTRKRDLFIDGSSRTTLGWIFGVATVAEHTPGSGWGAGMEFDPNSFRRQDFLRLAGNEAGSVMAIWKLDTAASITTDHLMYSVYDPALDEWSVNDFLVFEGQFIGFPSVTMNANGEAIAVWAETAAIASRYDPATQQWSVPVPISEEISPGFHRPGYSIDVAIDDSGNAIAVWDDGLSLGTSVRGSVWSSRYNAATNRWEEAFQIELGLLDATHAQVEMDGNGNAFVVWLQDNNEEDGWNDSFEIRARRYDSAAATWGPEVLVHDPDTRIEWFGFGLQLPLDLPSLAVDPGGNAILTWSEKINGEFLIRASRFDIGVPTPEWGPAERISDASWPFAIRPDIAIDASGNAAVVWQAGDDELFERDDITEVWTNRFTK